MTTASYSPKRRRWSCPAAIAAMVLILVMGIFTTPIESNTHCNAGLKLFSVESGNMVCAPLSSHTCIEACEWSSSCALTSHYEAFRGRRTYVSGMVFSGNGTLLLQCCASLGTIVEMNPRHEAICSWGQSIDTIGTKGSIRLNPPLAPNEYIRDMVVEKREVGGLVLRAQICKFVKQRPNCDRTTATSDAEQRQYSVLLLRLARTKELQMQGKSLNWPIAIHQPALAKPISKSKADGGAPDSMLFRSDDPRQPTNFHSFLNSSPQVTTASPLLMHSSWSPALNATRRTTLATPSQGTSVDGEAIAEGDSEDSLPFITPSLSLPVDDDTARLVQKAKDEPISGNDWLENGDIQPYFRPLGRSTEAGMSPRPRLFPPNSARRSSHRRRALPALPPSINRTRVFSPSPSPKQLAPGTGRLRFYQANQLTENAQRSANTGRNLGSGWSVEELPVKNEMAARKIHDGAATTSFGGSFAPLGDTSAELIKWNFSFTPSAASAQAADMQAGHNSLGGARFAPPTQVLSKAPMFKVIPISRPFSQPRQRVIPSFAQSPTPQPSQTHGHGQPDIWSPRPSISSLAPSLHPQPSPPNTNAHLSRDLDGTKVIPQQELLRSIDRNEVLPQSASEAALAGLLSCCEQQSPACRQLCSRDVSEEQIKHAIISHQCPPLSMTSVIQCYARYFNITPVGECCEGAAQHPITITHLEAEGGAHEAAFPSLRPNFPASGRKTTTGILPQQCTSLCAPNYRLSFSHLACMGHISTIVHCYRELILTRR